MDIYFARVRETALSNLKSSVFEISEAMTEEKLGKVCSTINEYFETFVIIEGRRDLSAASILDLIYATSVGAGIKVKNDIPMEKRHLKLIEGAIHLATVDTLLEMFNHEEINMPSWVREVFEEVKLFLVSEETLDIFSRETDIVGIVKSLSFAIKKYVNAEGDHDLQLKVVPAFLKAVRDHIGTGNIELSNEFVYVLNNKLLGL